MHKKMIFFKKNLHMSKKSCTFASNLKITLLTIKIITTMTRYVYMVESRTEKSKFGFKMFSSFDAAKKFVSMLPEFKHVITRHELYNMNSF